MVCSVFSFTLTALAVGCAPDFGAPKTYQGLGGPFAIADFDGDGTPDLAVAAGASIKTLLGVGDGTFQDPILSSVEEAGAEFSLDVGDFNSDGIPDLVTQVVYDGPFYYVSPQIYLGVGDGTFRPGAYLGGATIHDIAVGDLNGDQASDLVVTTYFNVGDGWMDFAVYALINDGQGSFSVIQFGTTGWPGPALIADFNRDGSMDVALQVSPFDVGGHRVQFLLGRGDGTFESFDDQPYEDPNFNPYDSSRTSFFAGEFNNDGATDVAVGATLFLGRGDGTFRPGATLSMGKASADFDGDGNLDIVGTTDASPHVIVTLGLGDGTFGPKRTTFTYAEKIRTADFDGDGRPDVAASYGAGLTILLNDGNWTGAPPPPVITIGNDTATEGDAGTANAVFNVRLSAVSSLPVSVQYSTGPSPFQPPATSGVDYQPTSGVLTFAPGEMEKTISVPVIGDLLTEPVYEYFSVTLSNPSNATLGNTQGHCAIYSEENPPIIDVSSVSKSEGDKGNGKFTFEVTLSAPIYQAVSVSYRTVDGSATTTDGDYSSASGTLKFAPGERTKTISVNVRGDRKREADEVFYVDLLNPSANASLGQSRGTGTIVNDD